MSKVTLTFEDVDGQVGMLVDLGEPFNEQSNAHKTANMVLNFLDNVHEAIEAEESMQPQDVEPRMVKTVEELNAIKASTLARIADQPIEIVRG